MASSRLLRMDSETMVRFQATSSAFLPRFLSTERPAVYLRNSRNRAELFLVGIDHVSPKSAQFVQTFIKDVRPNVVAVELCESRSKKLLSGEVLHKKYRFWEIFQIQGDLRQKFLTYFLRNMYAELAEMGLKPGEELRVAIEEGRALGASVSCIDQDLSVTLERAGCTISLKAVWDYLANQRTIARKYPNFCRALSHSEIPQCAEALMSRVALAEAIAMGETYFPGLVRTFLHERNEFMVKRLRELEGSIVGVVGAMHVPGMDKLWQEAELQCSSNKASGRKAFAPR